MTDFRPTSIPIFHLLQSFFLRQVGIEGFHFFNQSFFGCQMLLLLIALRRTKFFFLFKEIIASSNKTFPQGIGIFTRHLTYFFPFFLKLHQFVGCSRPLSAVFQSFHLFAKRFFLLQISIEIFFHSFVEVALSQEESITSSTITFENTGVRFLGSKTDGFPSFLQSHHFFGLGFPSLERSQGRHIDRFNSLTDSGFTYQIFRFGFFQFFKKGLVSLINFG